MGTTTDRNNPDLNVKGSNGQNKVYLVLSDEERAKGFVRPVRNSYVHVGKLIKSEDGVLEVLSEEDKKRHGSEYTHFLRYPESKHPLVGRALTRIEAENLNKRFGGCGTLTTINSHKIAETYARDPKFYGKTFCVGCRAHFAVDEFMWDGTEEEVGS